MYRIGEAARAVGISPATLRLWERQGLVSPGRTRGGNRWYGEEQLALPRRIQHPRQVEHLSPRASVRLIRQQYNGSSAPPAVNGASSQNGTSTAPDVGARPRAQRHRAGLTLRAVAEQTKMSASFLSAVERGVTGLAISRLHTLFPTAFLSDLCIPANVYGSDWP